MVQATCAPKIKVAIIGSGNIGTDLMIKVMRTSNVLEMGALAGIDPNSDGLACAVRLGVTTTAKGIAGLARLPVWREIGIVFDATSAAAHRTNSDICAAAGKVIVDLTPAAIGPYVIPVVNGDAYLDASNVNMVTCGGQAFYSILNTTGANSTFGAVQTQARLNVGWEYNAFGIDLFDNFVGSYRNWSASTVTPLVTRSDGAPLSGGDRVSAQHYFEVNFRYTLGESLLGNTLGGSQVFVDVSNLFDETPAFYNGNTGFDGLTGDPTGRVVTVGIRAKL
jgi:hypothetical protein